MSQVRFALLAALLAVPQAFGLLTLEDGKAELGVTAQAAFTWDSNLFNNANQSGDTFESFVAGITYDRNAGIIGVKASSTWTFDTFNQFGSENSVNPDFKLAFTKAQGKTTGALELGYRSTRQADNAANQRTRLGEFDGTLTLQYPVNHRFSLTSTTTVVDSAYKDRVFFDNNTFSQAIDTFFASTSKLDLFAGYRYRFTNASAQPDSGDHAFTVGAKGKLLPKVDGTVRVGYQVRDISLAGRGSIDALTASASLIWSPRNRVLVTTTVSKDFETTSTGLSTDALAWFNSVQITAWRQIAFTGGIGYSRSRFYALDERVRNDDQFFQRLGASYPVTTNINAEIEYTHSENWSTERFADYTKDIVSVRLSAKF